MSRRSILIAIVFVFLSAAGTVAYLWYQGRHTNPPRASQDTSGSKSTPRPTTDQCIANLPDSFKTGQKILPAVYSEQVDQVIPILQKYHIGGIILMDSATKDQIASLRDALSPSPIIAIDQEGGTVRRYTSEGIVPGASDITAHLSESQAYDTYLHDDTYLKGLGITTNFPRSSMFSPGRAHRYLGECIRVSPKSSPHTRLSQSELHKLPVSRLLSNIFLASEARQGIQTTEASRPTHCPCSKLETSFLTNSSRRKNQMSW